MKKSTALKSSAHGGRRVPREPTPTWWELRYPWERMPPWWRPVLRRRYKKMHERIRAHEYTLGITRDKYGLRVMGGLPWDYVDSGFGY